MKKVLLISPSDEGYLKNFGDRPPLGLLYIAAELEKNGVTVKVIDMNHCEEIELKKELKKFSPDYTGIGFTTPQYFEALKIRNIVKENSDSKLVAGGVHPTLMPESLKDKFDYIIFGEGERAMADLVKSVYKRKQLFFYSFVRDLDKLEKPARHLVDMTNYNLVQEGRKTATLITSRGCPGHCVYCSRTLGQTFRFHSAEYVFDELKQLKETYGYESFYFLDDSFTYKKARVYKICNLIKEAGWDISFRVTTRADLVNEDVIKWLSKIGLKLISIGVEHADNDVLKKSGKGMTIEQNEKAIEIAHKYGVKVKGFFILNLPGANKDTIRKTVDWAKKNVDYADFYTLVAFPGTALWKYPAQLGVRLLSTDFSFWEAGKEKGVNIDSEELPAEEIIKIKEAIENGWRQEKGNI